MLNKYIFLFQNYLLIHDTIFFGLVYQIIITEKIIEKKLG